MERKLKLQSCFPSGLQDEEFYTKPTKSLVDSIYVPTEAVRKSRRQLPGVAGRAAPDLVAVLRKQGALCSPSLV